MNSIERNMKHSHRQTGAGCRRIGCIALMLAGLILAPAEADGPAAHKTVRVFTVGSSSFGPELMMNASRIAETSGNARIEKGEDRAGYTRLNYFVSQPGNYEEWCTNNLPKIRDGQYDYVIFQTIGWLTMTPEQQDQLLTVIFPDLVTKIRKIGPEVMLYDKFITGTKGEKDPRAKKWDDRYPDGERLNNLLHILAAKKAGITKITFSGGAIMAGWEQDPFKNMKYFYNDMGHPGAIAHYINGCCAAYLLTGTNPVGNPVRKIPLASWIVKAFKDEPAKGGKEFYETWKGRVHGDEFTLTDEEAKKAQELAMQNHRKWDARLKAALADDVEFAKVEAEIRELRAGFDKPELVGMSEKGIAALRKKFAEKPAGQLVEPATIEKCRSKSGTLYDFHKFAGKALPAPKDKEAHQACMRYWTEHNDKFRDDVLFEAMLYEEQVTAEGDREEVARMKRAVAAVNNIAGMGGYRAIYERLDPKDRDGFLAKADGPSRRFAPHLVEALRKAQQDPETFFALGETYLKVWEDPNLMDKLKESKFAAEVFLEADKEFAKQEP